MSSALINLVCFHPINLSINLSISDYCERHIWNPTVTRKDFWDSKTKQKTEAKMMIVAVFSRKCWNLCIKWYILMHFVTTVGFSWVLSQIQILVRWWQYWDLGSQECVTVLETFLKAFHGLCENNAPSTRNYARFVLFTQAYISTFSNI